MYLRASLVLVLCGCFADSTARSDVAKLKQQLDELRRRTDGDRHATHELENRVFVLEDKVDTVAVAGGRGGELPRLPVVTKAPPPVTSASAAPPPAAPEPAELEEEPDDGAPAVVIRMRGDRPEVVERGSRPSPAALRRAGEPADLAAVHERLPMSGSRRPPATDDAAITLYKRAYAALVGHEHRAAIAGFRDFVRGYPDHDYADNAQYWLGEAYYDQADYQTALVEFRAVLERFPGGNKAPDALLKIGYCLDKLGETGAAGETLGQVVQIYPKTDAARLASRRLDEIRRVAR